MNNRSVEQIHRNKTGKVSDKWSSYLSFYDTLLKDQQNDPIRLLEIGVQNGGSIETWNEYFTNAEKIVGCDINPKCGELQYSNPRISIVVGDANNINTYHNITNLCDTYDVIIDDGSHVSNDILNSFLLYFPHLKPNGVYIIEDTCTLYWAQYGGGLSHDAGAYTFFKKLIDVTNIEHWETGASIQSYFQDFFPPDQFPQFIQDGWIESIEFRNSLIAIRKSANPTNNKLGERIVTGNDASVTNVVMKFKK